MRTEADFRGTITYASLNAHLKLVSKFYYKIEIGLIKKRWYMELLFYDNGIFKWENALEKLSVYILFHYLLDSTKDDVKDVKMKCLSDPERFLWTP